MNILYGVCGDGFGHSSRALVVTEFLEKKGHKVKIVTYGRGYEVLKKKFDVFKVFGLAMEFEKGTLKKRKTIKENFKKAGEDMLKWRNFRKLMKDFNPDLCMSDMEAIVPILSSWHRLPLVCLDNQHRMTNLEINVPKKYYKDYLLAKAVTKTFVARADHFIVTSFSKVKITKKNTTIVPPLIRPEVRKVKPKYGNKILVYLTRKNKKIENILKKINEQFVVYCYNTKKKDKNLEFKKKDTFLKDLKDCKAIIATSGFTLMSEALYLKKPYLALPLKGQFEQVLNALFLKKAGYGDYSDNLTEKDVVYFLHKLEEYKKNLKKYKIDLKKLEKVLVKVLSKPLT